MRGRGGKIADWEERTKKGWTQRNTKRNTGGKATSQDSVARKTQWQRQRERKAKVHIM